MNLRQQIQALKDKLPKEPVEPANRITLALCLLAEATLQASVPPGHCLTCRGMGSLRGESCPDCKGCPGYA